MRNAFWISATLFLGSLVPGLPSIAQTSQPATANPSDALEFRATQALNSQQYAIALPLLQQLELSVGNQPDRLSNVQEEIRVCQRNLSSGPATQPDPNATAAATATPYPTPATPAAGAPPTAASGDPYPMDPSLRVPHKKPAPGQIVDMEIKELGNFEYDAEQGGTIPADVKALDGCHFRTHGFMMPLDQVENITDFAFVPSLFGCCFGQPPQVQHTIVVHCAAGKAVAQYTSEPLLVEGTLHVIERKDDGFVISIFEMDATSVKVAN